MRFAPMPPPHELEKIAVELAMLCVLATTGWLVGRSSSGLRFIRGAGYTVGFTLFLSELA